MGKTQILEGSSVVLAVFTIFILKSTFLITYASYLLGILIVFYAIYLSVKKRSKLASELFTGSPTEIFGIISIILLITVLTEGLASPLFFFLYFILFMLAFMCQPITIWIFLISIILFFIPETTSAYTNDTFIKLGSLGLIAPIAFFVGRELQGRQILNRRIEAKTDDIIQEAEVLRSTTDVSVEDKNEAIEEIIEEAESLKKDAQS